MSDHPISAEDLPLIYQAKYLGACRAQGLWGIKHTRKPVDILVDAAKSNHNVLPIVEIKISTDGIQIFELASKKSAPVKYKIDSISYGVQDLNFTRVFCMIICNDTAPETPKVLTGTSDASANLFMCHAFACESRHVARQLTFALAAAFKHFADLVKSKEQEQKLRRTIDLRTQSQIDDAEDSETEA